MFDFAETTKNMTATGILNYYRNLYYAEPQVTERGIVANAINDVLPNMVEVVLCKDCKQWKLIDSLNPHRECQIFCGLHGYGYLTGADDFCSYGERRTNE